MKVSQVLYSGLGGHGSVVTSLINADKQGDWSSSLVFFGIEELLPAYHDFCETQHIPYRFIKKREGIFNTGWAAVLRAFRQLDPDIIILHSPTLVLPASYYCLFRRKKLFVVEHTPHATKSRAEKLATFFSLLFADKVVCLSSGYREQLSKQFRFLPVFKKTLVIENGIDLERFRPVAKNSTGELHIGMVGRFSPQKNQVLIIEAAEKGFLSGGLDKSIHFHFAGNGETLAGLEERVRNNNLDMQVHFHGLLDEEGVLAFLQKMDVYVHASFSETMCTSVMQAMAVGLPVLGSNIPGINDLVREGENAFLFGSNDAEKLVTLVNRMASDKDRRTAMGTKARESAEERFSAVLAFDRYKKMIESF